MPWPSLTAALFALGLCCSAGSAAASSHPSAEATRAEFEAVCRRLTEGESPFFGRASAERLEARLAAGGHAPAAEAQLRGLLAVERLRLGEAEAAIAQLEAALALGEKGAFEKGDAVHRALLSTLGTAHLQLAEALNCRLGGGAEACTLPVRAGAVHRRGEHTRAAARRYLELLELEAGALQARWLLNLAWRLAGDDPARLPAALRVEEARFAPKADFPRWPNVAADLGVAAFDLAGGAVMDDLDGDGRLDLVSSSWDPCRPLSAFRNDGRGGFEQVSAAWGLDAQLGGLNLVHADFDGDGRLDLLVLRGAWLGEAGRIRNSLLHNRLGGPEGRFVDVTAAAGLAQPAYPTQTAAWADFDLDGDLDLYVGNESSVGSTRPQELAGRTGRPFPSQLFRNDGLDDQGRPRFTDVARAAGVRNLRFAKGVTWGDYDGDGDPDLYVSNVGPNRLYRNDGPGGDGVPRFTDVAPELGVTGPEGSSFATWFFDLDDDGDLDLFVADYSAPVEAVSAALMGLEAGGGTAGGHPLLYRNDGPGGDGRWRFTEVSQELGLARPLLPMGANYGDLDEDGRLDLHLGTGVPNLEALMPNVTYRRRAGGGFEEVTYAGGFGHLQKGHGVAFGDLDGDGDQDLFEQLGGAYPYDAAANALYLNPGPRHSWVVLRLAAAGANRFGVGARLEVRVAGPGGGRSIHRLVGSGGSFGGSSLQEEVGLGEGGRVESIHVRWPGGALQSFPGVAPNRYYRLEEGRAEAVALELAPIDLHPGAAAAPRDPGHQH